MIDKVLAMPDKVLYTADGRNGHVLATDHRLDLDLSVPPELDGPGGPGTNPEQLFAAGYAACFHSALRGLARQAGVDAAQTRTRELAEAAHQGCPYSRATRGNISVELRAL